MVISFFFPKLTVKRVWPPRFRRAFTTIVIAAISRASSMSSLASGCFRSLRATRADLASQPTFSRLENGVDGYDVKRLHKLLVEHYLKTQDAPPRRVILDIDATEDPAHGKQQIHFHGFYGHYIYLPLLVYDGERGNLLGAVLRRGNAHASRVAVGLLGRIVRDTDRTWPSAV